jgi:hypothetical protein
VTHGATWQEQVRRIYRWEARVRRTRNTVRSDETWQEDQRDELLALFQSIWHLKDWLLNDPAVPATGRVIDTWINANGPNLLVAADVANGSKHLKLKNPRAGGSSHDGTDIRITLGEGAGLSQTFYIEDKSRRRPRDQRREALNVAKACVTEWHRYVRTLGLSMPRRG